MTDPALIAEASRSKELDRTNPGNRALSIFAGPHGYPTLLTGPSDARWRVVRYVLICHPFMAYEHSSVRGAAVRKQCMQQDSGISTETLR